jgi:hypothetical protein
LAQACEDTCQAIQAHFEILNTDVGLADALVRVMATEEFAASDEETKRTAALFMFDFEQSAIKVGWFPFLASVLKSRPFPLFAKAGLCGVLLSACCTFSCAF